MGRATRLGSAVAGVLLIAACGSDPEASPSTGRDSGVDASAGTSGVGGSAGASAGTGGGGASGSGGAGGSGAGGSGTGGAAGINDAGGSDAPLGLSLGPESGFGRGAVLSAGAFSVKGKFVMWPEVCSGRYCVREVR